MRRTRRAGWLAALATALLLAPAARAGAPADAAADAAAQRKPEPKWEIALAPYLWATAIKGNVSARGDSVDVDAPFKDILKELNLGAMGMVEVRRGRFMLLVDGFYAKLSDDFTSGPRKVGIGPFTLDRSLVISAGRQDRLTLTPDLKVQIPRITTTVGPLDVDATLTQVIIDTKLGFRAFDHPLAGLFGGTPEPDDPRRVIIDLVAGARYWYLKTELDLFLPPIRTPGFTIKSSVTFPRAGRTLDLPDVQIPGRVVFGGIDQTVTASEDWVDLITGLRVRVDLTPRLFLVSIADVGGFGFGSSSDLTWSAVGLVGWRLSDRWSLLGGFKALNVQRDHADLTMQGLVMGAVYRFGVGH